MLTLTIDSMPTECVWHGAGMSASPQQSAQCFQDLCCLSKYECQVYYNYRDGDQKMPAPTFDPQFDGYRLEVLRFHFFVDPDPEPES